MIEEWIANRLPRSILYWVLIRVWAHLTVNVYPSKTPDEVTIWDALKEYKDA